MKPYQFAMVLALGAAASLQAGTISFDDLDTSGGAVQLTNQYASSGVLFTNLFAAQQFKFNILPPSTPNYASPFWVDLNPGFITFVDPANSSIPGLVASVSFTLVGLSVPDGHPGNFSGATIVALDGNGNSILGQTVTIPGVSTATANDPITFTGDIHALEFIHVDGTTGTFPIDDLTFGTVTGVPEPSTFALLALAFGAAVAARRRGLIRVR